MQAPEKTERRQQATESMRLALSMRGGVSLAVWIGGAVAEIDTLRKASQAAVGPVIPTGPVDSDHNVPHRNVPNRNEVYSALLELASYSHVEVDILTGASAGGLNGAIYAASLVYGFDFDDMKDVWLELADIEALSRPVVWNTFDKAPSLLDGDGYFFEKCRKKLEEFVAHRQEQTGSTELKAQVERLDLLLSATRRVPERHVLRNDSFNEINESRSSAFFHFRHLGQLDSPLSDFGADPTGNTYADSVNRLAHAGRASSSFPVAFEPATITSTPHEATSASNLFGMFSESGAEVEVLDGGVLDNIPVAKAIEAIAAAPAEAPTSRWLLYLHPSPAEVVDHSAAESAAGAEVDEPQKKTRSRLVGVIADLKATLSLKFNNESLVDDMVDLDRHNARVVERRATRIALLRTARREPLAPTVAQSAWAAADAQHVRELLADPPLATATHPFVKRVYDDLSADWTPAKRSALFTLLQEAIASHYETTDAHAGADQAASLSLVALTDTVEVLLAMAQQVLVENRDAQRILYRVRLLVQVLNSVWEQSWLEAVEHAPGDSSAEVVDWIAATARDCMLRSEIVTDEVVEELSRTDRRYFDPLHHALRALYDDRMTASFDNDPTGPSLAEVWALVEQQADAIVQEAAQAGNFEDPVIDVLEEALANRELGLQWFAQVCAPLHRRRVTGESEIRFLRVAGSNESPLARYFTGSDEPLSVQDKLAGNQVANFGAFFSAQFRANDWMWGRLDAAKSLVDLLADSMRWFNDDETSVDVVFQELKSIITSPFGEQQKQKDWHDWAKEQWLMHSAEVEQELSAAKPSAKDGVSHPLDVTKKLLVGRLQAEILCEHIHWVTATGETVDEPRRTDTSDADPPATAADCLALAGTLTAGTDRVPRSLDTKRWARIGIRLGLNAWNAMTPGGMRQLVIALFKPLYLSLIALLVLPRRAMLAGALGLGALAVGRWETGTQLFSSDPDLWFVSGAGAEFLSWSRVFAAAIAVTAGFLAVMMQLRGSLPNDTPRRSFIAAGGAASVVLIGAGLVILEAAVSYGLVILGAAVAAAVVVAVLYRSIEKPAGHGKGRALAWAVVLVGGLIAGAVLAMMVTRASLLPGIVPIVAVFVVLIGMNWMHWPHRLAIATIAVLSYVLWWQALERSPGWWAVVAFTTAVFLATLYVSKIDVFGSRVGSQSRLPRTVIDVRTSSPSVPSAGADHPINA